MNKLCLNATAQRAVLAVALALNVAAAHAAAEPTDPGRAAPVVVAVTSNGTGTLGWPWWWPRLFV